MLIQEYKKAFLTLFFWVSIVIQLKPLNTLFLKGVLFLNFFSLGYRLKKVSRFIEFIK